MRRLHAQIKTLCGVLLLAMVATWAPSALAAGTCESITFNQLPNPEFRGSKGALVANASGQVPTQWRTFAIGAGAASTSVIPLAADAVFPGSPPHNAVQLTVSNFGTPGVDDSGFDTSPFRFTLEPDRPYRGSVYLRSANPGGVDQGVNIALPIFDSNVTFTGQFGLTTVTATSTWTRYELSEVTTSLVGASGELSFRLVEGASDNSVQIAFPRVEGPALENRVPNPGFTGTAGDAAENVTGSVPDLWRAFGLNSVSASIALQTVPLPPGELYPGSPATNAIRISTREQTGSGFDHEGNRLSLAPAGRLVWTEAYVRADNADNSSQAVSFSAPVFDQGGNYLNAPGSIGVTVGNEWEYLAGNVFSGAEGTTTDLAFRLIDSGAENTVLIALPALRGPAGITFCDGFEGEN